MVTSQKQGFSERSKCFPRISRGKMPKLFELLNYDFLRFQLFQLTFKLNKLNPLLIQFQFLRSGENQRFLWKTSYLLPKPVKSRPKILQVTPKEPCNLTFLSTYPLLIHRESTSIHRESTLNLPQFTANLPQSTSNSPRIHREFAPFQLTSNINKPEMSEITGNQ
jgi:hypothetical protein